MPAKLRVLSDDFRAYERPKTRGDCKGMARPCPHVGCKFHLLLEVTDTGSIQGANRGPGLNCESTRNGVNKTSELMFDSWSERLVDHLMTMPFSCSLDAIDQLGDMTLEEIGQAMGVTRERIRQIESKGVKRMRRSKSRMRMIVDAAEKADRVIDEADFAPHSWKVK